MKGPTFLVIEATKNRNYSKFSHLRKFNDYTSGTTIKPSVYLTNSHTKNILKYTKPMPSMSIKEYKKEIYIEPHYEVLTFVKTENDSEEFNVLLVDINNYITEEIICNFNQSDVKNFLIIRDPLRNTVKDDVYEAYVENNTDTLVFYYDDVEQDPQIRFKCLVYLYNILGKYHYIESAEIVCPERAQELNKYKKKNTAPQDLSYLLKGFYYVNIFDIIEKK